MAASVPRVCVPVGSHMLCHHCLVFGVSEENEITRHYRIAHPDRTEWYGGSGTTPYHLCRIVDDNVANRLGARLQTRPLHTTTPNRTYKSRPATVQEMQAMFMQRQLPVPSPGLLVPVNVPAAPAAPVAPTVPTPAGPAIAAAPAADDDDDAMNLDEEEVAINEQMRPEVVGIGPDSRPDYGHFLEQPEFLARLEPPDNRQLDDIYTCHLCIDGPRFEAKLPEMVDHYDRKHEVVLQNELETVYTGRWIDAVVRGAMSHAEITEAVSHRNIGRRNWIGHGTVVDMHDLKCYKCMDVDQVAPGWTLAGLDNHFARDHVDERWDIMDEVMAKWSEEIKAKDKAED